MTIYYYHANGNYYTHILFVCFDSISTTARVYILLMACIDLDECAEGVSGCAQNCTDTDGGYNCSCYDGYLLENDDHSCNGNFFSACLQWTIIGQGEDFLFIIDVDECQENLHSCQHICTNTDGSFSCGCNEGFMLDGDGQNCTGKIINAYIA